MSSFPNEYEGGSPILLSAAAVNVAAGGTAQPNMLSLTNPFRVPMVIDEIRWQLTSGVNAAGGRDHSGFSVSCKLSFGRHLICNYTPIWLFGPTVQDGYEPGVLVVTIPAVIITFQRWKLPRPLFVPAGMSVIPSFVRLGTVIDTVAGNIAVEIAYAGRLLDAGASPPSAVNVPYVGSFSHPIGQTVSKSNELNLVNLSKGTLHVQRFVGRVATPPGAGNFPEPANDVVTIGMRDGLDRLLVPDGTPFAQVFDMNRRAWTNGQELEAGQFYRADLANVPITDQPQIAMIGWREEVL